MKTTLHWQPPVSSDTMRIETIMGPGAPYELVEEPVLGVAQPVFARRLPNLKALLEVGAEQYRDRPYLVHPEGTITFAEAAALVASAAAQLHEDFGVEKGDRVALASATRIEHVIAAWAVICLGAVVVELNAWWSGPELEYGIDVTEPKLLLCDDPRLSRLHGRSPNLAGLRLEDLWPEWTAGSAPMPSVRIEEDDPFVILFTSGTTGRPKGAMLSHRNNLHWIQSIGLRAACSGRTSGGATCEVAALPMFHISGLNSQTILSVATGTKLVYLADGHRWSADEHLRISEQHQVTMWRIVPTQGWKLVDSPLAPAYELPRLRAVSFGGSFVPPVLLQRLTARWPATAPGVVVGFGMTETNGTGASGTLPEVMSRPGCVGGPLPGSSVRVCDPRTGDQCDDGEIGEVQIRSASVFLGYHNDSEATSAVLDEQRWYRTGDYGKTLDGRLVLEGRRSDLIIRNGENIYPREIEDRLLEHPGVAEAVVFGVPDRVSGEHVAAVVVPRPRSTIDIAELRRWLTDRLAGFKVPEHIEVRAALPQNALGKTMKHLLHADPGGDPPMEGSS